jgi:hypothetical protein
MPPDYMQWHPESAKRSYPILARASLGTRQEKRVSENAIPCNSRSRC